MIIYPVDDSITDADSQSDASPSVQRYRLMLIVRNYLLYYNFKNRSDFNVEFHLIMDYIETGSRWIPRTNPGHDIHHKIYEAMCKYFWETDKEWAECKGGFIWNRRVKLLQLNYEATRDFIGRVHHAGATQTPVAHQYLELIHNARARAELPNPVKPIPVEHVVQQHTQSHRRSTVKVNPDRPKRVKCSSPKYKPDGKRRVKRRSPGQSPRGSKYKPAERVKRGSVGQVPQVSQMPQVHRMPPQVPQVAQVPSAPALSDLESMEYTVLTHHEVTDLKESTECSICLGNFDPDHDVVIITVKCRHKFHEPCYKRLREGSVECPNCRGPLC